MMFLHVYSLKQLIWHVWWLLPCPQQMAIYNTYDFSFTLNCYLVVSDFAVPLISLHCRSSVTGIHHLQDQNNVYSNLTVSLDP